MIARGFMLIWRKNLVRLDCLRNDALLHSVSSVSSDKAVLLSIEEAGLKTAKLRDEKEVLDRQQRADIDAQKNLIENLQQFENWKHELESQEKQMQGRLKKLLDAVKKHDEELKRVKEEQREMKNKLQHSRGQNWKLGKRRSFAFPIRRHLVLVSCDKLNAVPLELADIPNLHEMKLDNTSKAVKSAKDILEREKSELRSDVAAFRVFSVVVQSSDKIVLPIKKTCFIFFLFTNGEFEIIVLPGVVTFRLSDHVECFLSQL
ncbi:hypothetical protein FXO38_29405 [Capsicum annuum]|nr:hypothetical protein FXO38_29405 [Capsicum annuum]KAF3627533.1 hypothetical protein FXO37_29822 [Capsicum annuum]